MNEKQYLISQITKCRRKLNLALFFNKLVCFATVGSIVSIILEAISLFIPFFYVHAVSLTVTGIMLLAGMGYGLWKRKDDRDAAAKMDSFGLKERMMTAYEHLSDESEFAKLQRADAVLHLREEKERIRISILPKGRQFLAFFLALSLAAGLAFVPSTAGNLAKQRHEVAQEAKKEEKELEKLLHSMEKIDTSSMTEEQKAQLNKLMESMKLSMKELKASTTKESLQAAQKRLDYKYNQAASRLSELASGMENPEASGVAAATQLAKAAGNKGNPEGTKSASASANKGNSTGSGESGSNTENSNRGAGGDGTESGSSGSGGGKSTESGGNGNGNGTGNGTGNGNGNGNGNGSGSGNGRGSGSGGNGSGTGGSGRGTGSGGATHDYVSVPNGKGQDDSLQGKKNGSDHSEYYREQNGLAWEGDHVSLDSVVGDYTRDAYEGISSGKYPRGMEPVIKDYFKNLNE